MRLRICLFAVLLGACGGGGSGATSSSVIPESIMPELEPPVSPDATSTSVPTAAGTASDGSDVPANLLGPVLTDAASRAGIGVDAVTVLSSVFKDWPDGSLGCPEPGMLYTQVLTPGYQVVVDAGGEEYDYRMGRTGTFRLCETGGSIPDIRTPSTLVPRDSPDT